MSDKTVDEDVEIGRLREAISRLGWSSTDGGNQDRWAVRIQADDGRRHMFSRDTKIAAWREAFRHACDAATYSVVIARKIARGELP